MGKVIKNLTTTLAAALCGALGLVVVLPPVLSLVVSVPAVQNAVVRRLVSAASERIGTRVSVGEVRIGFFNKLDISDFYVEDFDGDTLLYVRRLSAPVEGLGLGAGPLALGRVKVAGAELWLRKDDPEESMNISRVVDAISPGPSNPDKRFAMRVRALEVDSLTFALLRPYAERIGGGVDFGRFVLRSALRVNDLRIAGDTVSMEIGSLSCTERAGLDVEMLSARRLAVSRGAVMLDDVRILARGSELTLPAVHLEGQRRLWRDFREFSDSVEMNIDMNSSRVTSDLVGVFAPAVAGWSIALDDVSAYTLGALSSLRGGVENARTLGTSLKLDFTSRGLPRLSTAEFAVSRLSISTDGEDVAALYHSMTGRGVPDGVAKTLARLGRISLENGELDGNLHAPVLRGMFETDAGDLSVDLAMELGGGRAATFGGSLATSGFELGRLLDAADLGDVAGSFRVNGSVPRGMAADGAMWGLAATLRGEIGGMSYRGHRYRDIAVNGRLGGRRLEAEVSVDDPALEADLKATLDRSAPLPRHAIEIDLGRFDLAAVGFRSADSAAVLSGRLAADISGRRLDEVNGTVELTDAAYRSARGEVSTRRATLQARSTAEGKLLTLRSEFADGEVRSRTGYRDVAAYLGGFLQNYIALPRLRATKGELTPPDGGNPAAMSNYSIASIDVKEAAPLLDVFFPTASVAAGSGARFMFNPYTGGFSLSGHADFVEWGGMLAEKVEFTGDNTRDSLKLRLTGGDLYSRRGHVQGFELRGGTRGGRTRVDAALGSRRWRAMADSLGFGDDRIVVRDAVVLSADNPRQRLTATGAVSALEGDTLRVRLEDFDLSPLGRLVGTGLGADMSGRATGWLDVASARSNPRTSADVRIEELAVGGHTAPPLRLRSLPERDGGVRFGLVDERSGGDIVAGTLSATGELAAALSVDSLDAALLDPLLGGVLEGTEGRASARLELRGSLRKARADGYIDVGRLETTVAYTRARYGVREARIAVENSTLTLPSTPVTSGAGGSGQISMRVELSNFADVAARVDVRTDRMLVFDTSGGAGAPFYGRVMATGTASIRSDRMGTRLDVAARTDDGTVFHLPLNAHSDVSWTDFVTFTARSPVADTAGVLARKRLDYRRRLSRGAGASSKPVELNLMANVTPAAEIHLLIGPSLGPGITARGEGVIDLDVDPRAGRFTMTGDYNIASGRFELSMLDLFNKTFEIAPGSALRWSGSPTDASLAVDASWRTRASLRPLVGEGGGISGRMVPVECIIRLRESLSDPDITFDIAMPSADTDQRQIAAGAMNTPELKSMQFLSLLTTGSFAANNSITGQSSNAGVLAGGAVAFDILTAQLNNLLSSDDYDIFLRYRPQDDFSGSRMEAGFSTRLWGDRLELEVEGNYENNRAATSTGLAGARDLAGEGSVTWVIDRSGNLRLRAFSRTIDRLNETQGLQEYGLGVYLRRDFNRLRDLFRRRERRTASVKSETID